MSDQTTLQTNPGIAGSTGTKKLLFWLIVGLQFGVLAWLIVDRKLILSQGDSVLLKCQPIDPRSLFSGDYVILNYEISRFSGEHLGRLYKGDQPIAPGERVFVALEKNAASGFHEPVRISKTKADAAAKGFDGVVIRGRAQNYYYPQADHSGSLRLRYGVENYFVPQREGRIIETSLARASVEVAVKRRTGESGIKKLLLDGEEVTFY